MLASSPGTVRRDNLLFSVRQHLKLCTSPFVSDSVPYKIRHCKFFNDVRRHPFHFQPASFLPFFLPSSCSKTCLKDYFLNPIRSHDPYSQPASLTVHSSEILYLSRCLFFSLHKDAPAIQHCFIAHRFNHLPVCSLIAEKSTSLRSPSSFSAIDRFRSENVSLYSKDTAVGFLLSRPRIDFGDLI